MNVVILNRTQIDDSVETPRAAHEHTALNLADAGKGCTVVGRPGAELGQLGVVRRGTFSSGLDINRWPSLPDRQADYAIKAMATTARSSIAASPSFNCSRRTPSRTERRAANTPMGTAGPSRIGPSGFYGWPFYGIFG